MPWMRVDDQLHNHRKARTVLRSAEPKRRDCAPMGLWALAGSWCGQNRTGGFVPAELLDDWDDNAQELAQRLVDARLWIRDEMGGEPGFRFHDWEDQNPLSGDAATSTASRSGSFGNHVRWHVKKGRVDEGCGFCMSGSSGSVAPESGAIRGDDSSGSSGSSGAIAPDEPDIAPIKSATQGNPQNPSVLGSIGSIAPVPIPKPNREEGGYVSRERYERETVPPGNEPPPPTSRCIKHPRGTTAACADCRANRETAAAEAAEHHQRAVRERAQQRATVGAEKAAAIAACSLCNADGYRGAVVCDHVDHAPAAARGRAKVQAELDAIASRRAS